MYPFFKESRPGVQGWVGEGRRRDFSPTRVRNSGTLDFGPSDSGFTLPLVGPLLKKIGILTDILAELRSALSTLKEAEEKVESGGKAFFEALAATGAAITAVLTAIADPEPISKAALIVTAIGLIGLAIYAIIDVINIIDKNEKDKKKIKKEMKELNRNKRNLEDLVDQLKNV